MLTQVTGRPARARAAPAACCSSTPEAPGNYSHGLRWASPKSLQSQPLCLPASPARGSEDKRVSGENRPMFREHCWPMGDPWMSMDVTSPERVRGPGPRGRSKQ